MTSVKMFPSREKVGIKLKNTRRGKTAKFDKLDVSSSGSFVVGSSGGEARYSSQKNLASPTESGQDLCSGTSRYNANLPL